MSPEWLLQVIWWGAGVGGSGAVWYFMSVRNYHAALWTGFGTAVVVLLAIALHIRNDIVRNERQRASVSPRPAAPERPASTSLPAEVTTPIMKATEEAKAIAPSLRQQSGSPPPAVSPDAQGPDGLRTSSELHQPTSAELEQAPAPAVKRKPSTKH